MWAEQEEVFQEREKTGLGPGVDHGGGVDQDPEGGEVTDQGVDQQEEAILKMGTDSTLEVTDIISILLQDSLIFLQIKTWFISRCFYFCICKCHITIIERGFIVTRR